MSCVFASSSPSVKFFLININILSAIQVRTKNIYSALGVNNQYPAPLDGSRDHKYEYSMSHQSKPSNSDRKPSSNGNNNNNNISTSSNGNLKENVNGSQLQFSSTTSTAANHHQHQSIHNQHIPLSPQAPPIFSNRTPLGDHIGGQQMGGTQPMVPPGVVAIYLACSKIYNNQPNPLQVTAVRKYW